MRCIFLDIASHDGLLACVSAKGVLAFREVNARIRDHELIPLVEELLKEAGWKYEDLTHVACVIGPGGFTSLRIAVSLANTLMDQLNILGVGIHLSDLYLARVPLHDSRRVVRSKNRKVEKSDMLWLHATKRDSLFVRGMEWTEPTLVSLKEFSEKVPKGTLWMGELLDGQKEALGLLELKEAHIKSTAEVLSTFLHQLDYARELLKPWYGRIG